MFSVGIITASDTGYKREREDISGQLIQKVVTEKGYQVKAYKIVPDEQKILKETMIHMCDTLKVNLILTTGGTGLSKRDVTPEATQAIIEKEALGISEAIRYYGLLKTSRAMLSRGISGIRKDTLIINLPGSPKAVQESLDSIMDAIHHGLEILTGSVHDCGKNE
ncbi:molybdopterin adenylyltransferase [Natranaerovirga hydrolytica]|uniref:Molybdopterin adenylyltransferase n=1 Tax=Natranaerovirga hydrolytica TaxID=680378 RepID=A0A4R1N556_9FIRM|nr:MogA/MoaB family molybdenum cofactor biosynthesis protein [Natranaerovirga hydrolytica]TCK97743.1 molybdopterin adenylyltransferase [Natranaerovirga hydrolytica]